MVSFSYSNPLKSRLSDAFFQALPERPGVYFMRGRGDEILYIGKAKCLKKRVSSYRLAKPGQIGEHIIELLEQVEEIRWEECTSESEALSRESELIRALHPPFNIAGNWPEAYLSVGLRDAESRTADQKTVDFRLSSVQLPDGFKTYGCFPHRGKVKAGYSALLRLFYAANFKGDRFAYPARITRASPAYIYQLELREPWLKKLHLFLKGRSSELAGELSLAILDNEAIPPFMAPSIEMDLRTLKEWYRQSILSSRKAALEQGLTRRSLSAQDWNRWVRASLDRT